jgi:ADP-ribose pyrophosphatase YjhB (NUDIX family)/quinol monooxygenase YgiN
MSTAGGSDVRTYPARPIAGVGAIVVDGQRRVLLVKRANPPLAGRWSLPGGRVELGETLVEAVAREVLEETGLVVKVGPLVDVIDRIHRDSDGRVEYHYVLLDHLCQPAGGVLRAATDAAEVTWAAAGDLGAYGIVAATRRVIEHALEMVKDVPMSSEHVVIQIHYRAKPGKEAQAAREIAALIATVQREEPDCLGITMLRSADDPTRILLHERWTSRQAYFGPHMQTPHIRAFIAAAPAFVAGPPEISVWTTDAAR